ncbi:GGDEF domain-containing protein, partial [Polymorphospora sp. NPDC050346]|uniref:GGDEF domain-containing protein n=1 Tax=Polymorphospora sp. NPDC050346 TaxID=3155780 RepID=UPI0033C5A789
TAVLSARHPVTLAIFDLDGFKSVNDNHGHEAGDAVLREVAARLAAIRIHGSRAYRMQGDEFAYVYLMDHAGAEIHANAIRAAMGAPVNLPGGLVRCGGSLGLAQSTPNGTLSDLLRRADEAMYDAKPGTAEGSGLRRRSNR